MDYSLGSWNVRTLNRTGALRGLLQEVSGYNINILAIQETKWIGCEINDLRSHTVFTSGKQAGSREFGVAFIIDNSFKHLITGFKPINERLCAIRLKLKFFNIWLINCHAPTEDKDENIKDEFYSTLERTYDSLPSNDIKILLGDFNAKVGREETHRGTTGGHSLHQINNNNGQRLVDFATSKNLIISSTCFPHKDIHKRTWSSPDGRTFNQIDHILIEKRAATSILDVRSFRGANCDSDHYLVRAKYRCRITRQHDPKKNRARKYEIDNLNNEHTAAEYASKLTTHFGDISPVEMNVEQLWTHIKNGIKSTTEEIVGYKGRRRRNDWFDEECKEALAKKNDAYRKYVERPTRAKKEHYDELRRYANRMCRRKQREHNNKAIEKLDADFNSNNIRAAYATVKQLKQGYKPQTDLCKDKEGNIISNPDDIKQRWVEYFQNLLNPASVAPPTQTIIRERTNVNCTASYPPTVSEVEAAIRDQKSNKAPGIDEIPAELWKKGGPSMVNLLHELLVKIWTNERIPDDWRKSIICPIHKKGDKLSCDNYRGISLLCSSYKILTKIIERRLRPYTDRIIGEYQGGFRAGRSTIDQIFSVKQVLEKCWEFNIDVHQVFVDFQQAYDSIDRNVLYKIMLDFGIPPKLVRMTKVTMEDTEAQVRIQGVLTNSFKTDSGLKQGDGLAPVLFNLALEYVIRRIPVDTSGTLLVKSTQLVAYADDINIMALSIPHAKEAFLDMSSAAKQVGLRVNEGKTKFMTQTRRNAPTRQNITLGEYNLENVDSFVYLGTQLKKDGSEKDEIERRINLANKAFYAVLPTLKSQKVHRKNKFRIYKTIIRPVLLYGCETWTLTQSSEKAIDTFERRILRRIIGPTREGSDWRIRYNHELYDIYDDPAASIIIKLRKLQWAGHVERMDEIRVPKRALKGQANGRRPTGKPRKRWEDSIDADSQKLLGFRNWRTRSLNRDDWRRSILEAKARFGLSRH